MRRLMNWIRQRREAAHERTRMARVEEELRIQRELEYIQSRQGDASNKRITVSNLSTPSLMSQSITDIQRRCQ